MEVQIITALNGTNIHGIWQKQIAAYRLEQNFAEIVHIPESRTPLTNRFAIMRLPIFLILLKSRLYLLRSDWWFHKILRIVLKSKKQTVISCLSNHTIQANPCLFITYAIYNHAIKPHGASCWSAPNALWYSPKGVL
jgi:hypothetical protein